MGSSRTRSYQELLRVTGPLLSLVFRTEDVWQKCNQFIETAGLSIRVSPSHPYDAGRAGLEWMSGCKFTLLADDKWILLVYGRWPIA